MCGIAGILRFDDRPIERDRLEAMLGHVRHRGPDGEGISEHHRCGLVHTRLSIIDLLSGAQPMHLPKQDSRGGLHLVFNGEIYNHRSLRKLLEKRGHQFRSDHSDTEVLLYGYREWGDRLPKHLHGMFAFAIWDQDARRLYLARDRMGKKPLYVRRANNELSFASLVATLIVGAGSGASPTVDREALVTYLRLGYPFLRSMVSGIEEIPPAHWMWIDPDGSSLCERYWQPPPISKTSTALGAVDALREVVTEAVHERLEADVELGCFLSGGIDSSLIAAVAQRRLTSLGAEPLQTFSVSMPDAAYDESVYAKLVAEHVGANHTVLETRPGDAIADLERLMAISGEPTADSSLLPTFWLCQATRQHVKAALSGDGGDELFGGYDRYRAMRLLRRYRGWLSMMPAGIFTGTNPRSRRVRVGRLLSAARAGTEPDRQFLEMIHLFSESQIGELLDMSPPDDALPGLEDWPPESDAIHAAMRWDQTHYLPYELLRKIDRASMAVALEVRCPLLATPVCDLAGHLPASVLMPGGRPKGLLRALASEMLPMPIVQRSKRGFALPIGGWLRGRLADDLADRLFDGTLSDLGIAEAPVRRLFDEHRQSRADHTHRLFALLQLSLWGQWLKAPIVPPVGI